MYSLRVRVLSAVELMNETMCVLLQFYAKETI